MKIVREVRLPYGVEEAKEQVYRYLQVNGMYPINEDWTRFYAYAMRRDFGDPRRFRLDVLLSYRPDEEGTKLKIVFFFQHKYAIEKLFGRIKLTSSDKEFYRGFLDHFMQSLRTQSPEHYTSAQDEIMYAPSSDIMYVFIILALPVLAYAAVNSWETAMWYLWGAVLILIIGYFTFAYLRRRRKMMKGS